MLVSPDRSILYADGVSPAGGPGLAVLPARSPQWVVVWTLRSVLDPGWVPEAAAAGLIEQVPEAEVLRRALAQLRSVTRQRSTVRQARAIATLNLALELAGQRGGNRCGGRAEQ